MSGESELTADRIEIWKRHYADMVKCSPKAEGFAEHVTLCDMALRTAEAEMERDRLQQVVTDYGDQIRQFRAERERMLTRYGKPLAWACMARSGDYDYTVHGTGEDAREQAEFTDLEDGKQSPPVVPLYALGNLQSELTASRSREMSAEDRGKIADNLARAVSACNQSCSEVAAFHIGNALERLLPALQPRAENEGMVSDG